MAHVTRSCAGFVAHAAPALRGRAVSACSPMMHHVGAAAAPHITAGASSIRRRFATDAAAARAQRKAERVVEVPTDKSTISPVRSMFYGSLASYAAHCTPFPIALSAEASATLAAVLEPVNKFMGKVPSTAIDEAHRIDDATMAGLKELGLFGLQIPEEYGGLGLSNTAYARVAEEIVMDPSIAVTLMAHQSIGLKGILLCGNAAQKAKYLPALASGEHIAAFALTEPSTGSDAASIRTTATPTEDGSGFVLNGQKMWISNGGIAQIYTVFARTPAENGESKITAFIVDRAFGGITPGPPERKLGIRGSNTCVVTFDKCVVPRENVLGEVNGGFKVAMMILNNGRFGMGAATGGGLAKLISLAADYANARIQFGAAISSFPLIQEKFARMAVDAYTVSSMSYMTTALIDGKPQLDCSVEAAICKVYGSEAMYRGINECIQVLGGMGFAAGGAYPFERLLRDSRILLIFEGTNEILRLFIALTCIAGPGAELKALAAAARNPLTALSALPQLASRYLAANYGIGVTPLPGVAPAMKVEADAVAAAVPRFAYAVQTLLATHGKGIINKQLQLQRVANMAIDLYACTCVLSRVTRAIADNVPHAAHEQVLARAAVQAALKRFDVSYAEALAGEAANGDKDTIAIASEMLSAGRYLATHPIRV